MSRRIICKRVRKISVAKISVALKHCQISAAERLIANAGTGISLFAQSGGARFIAHRGPVGIQARHDDDEYSAEPWFPVGEHDIFPEEFRAFLTLPGRVGQAFLEAHGDLLTVDYWRHMQRLAEQGEIVDIFPYKPSRRLRA